MLSNIQIVELAKKLKIPDFRGVFSRDKLPNQLMSGSFIINMESDKDDRGRPNQGSHWVASYIDHKMEPIYFDSFGFPAPIEVERYAKQTKKQLIYSRKEIQNISSSCCGYYSLYFCKYMSNHVKLNYHYNLFHILNDFQKQFSDDTTKNEKILQDLYNGKKF